MVENLSAYDNFAERFGSFPDLTFSQFMELMAAAFNDEPHQDFQNDAALGRYTVEFIKDHFYNPDTVITKLSEVILKVVNINRICTLLHSFLPTSLIDSFMIIY
jgi:hypothetical protein